MRDQQLLHTTQKLVVLFSIPSTRSRSVYTGRVHKCIVVPSTMAGDNPQADLVSTETFHIAGIPIHVYGLTELKASNPVDCLWLLHRRNGDYTQMTSFANRVIKAWISNPLSSTRGLIAIAFDHRNHGARLVDPVANKGWRKNKRHAADVYSIYRM